MDHLDPKPGLLVEPALAISRRIGEFAGVQVHIHRYGATIFSRWIYSDCLIGLWMEVVTCGALYPATILALGYHSISPMDGVSPDPP